MDLQADLADPVVQNSLVAETRQRLVIGVGHGLMVAVDRLAGPHCDRGQIDARDFLFLGQEIARRRVDPARIKSLRDIHDALDDDLRMCRYAQINRLARHHLDILVHDRADHFHLSPDIHVHAGEIGHDLKSRVNAENDGDGHFGQTHVAVFLHDDVGVRRRETHEAVARPDRGRPRMRRIVKPGLRVLHDIHRRDITLALFR